MKWTEAWNLARPMLEGAERGHVATRDPRVELAYLDWGGDGDLVVIHPANGFCAAAYAPIAVGLRDRLRVVCFDPLGHCESTFVDPEKTPEAYEWNSIALDYSAALVHLVAKLGRDRIRLAIGHSYGGILTLIASAEHPDLIEDALLLDPVVRRPSADHAERSGRGIHLAAGARQRRAVFPSREDAFDHFSGRGIFKDFRPESLALYVAEGLVESRSGEFRLSCEPSVESAIFERGGNMNVFPFAPKVGARVRLLHAERGHFSRQVYLELANQLQAASVESVDAGHLLAMERPEIAIEWAERLVKAPTAT